MSMAVHHIERQLDEIVVRWVKAGQEERARLVVERLRLERQLDEIRRQNLRLSAG